MGTIHKHSTQSRNLDIMTNKNWTCIKMYKKALKRNIIPEALREIGCTYLAYQYESYFKSNMMVVIHSK